VLFTLVQAHVQEIDMSTFDTSNLENTSGGAPDFSQGLNVGGTDILTLVTPTEYYTGASGPSSPANGAVWYDGTDVLQYVNGGWYTLTVTPPPLYLGDTVAARFNCNIADFPDSGLQTYNIATTGNATNFGDLTNAIKINSSAASNRTIGVFVDGQTTTKNGGYSTVSTQAIEYYTFATLGNATSFGDATESCSRSGAMSDGTYGVFGPKSYGSFQIIYITFATPGNATDFGDASVARSSASGCSDGSRGVMAGGYYYSNVIDYITIATPGNAIDFGDLTAATQYLAGCSDTTRGVFAGGEVSGSQTNTIGYVTIQTLGNATDFGDLTVARRELSAAANETRGTFAGGIQPSTPWNTIDYVTIQTPGNATDFGDLTSTTNSAASATSGG
tara:strand:+ start:294 stop:1460 length:1167 start_codon:yes stop_codon:yes gene_type:complete